MQIAILGAGNVGGALARLWSAAGHSVVVGSRAPGGAAHALPPGVEVLSYADAANAAETVVISIPWPGVQSALAAAGDLSGKLLIDTSNPLLPDLSGLALGTSNSAAEQVAVWAPGARVVKAFNTIGAVLLGDANFGGQQASGFLCGDDAGAKAAAGELVRETGLEPVDVGPLRMARNLEAIAMLWIDMAVNQQRKSSFAFKLLER